MPTTNKTNPWKLTPLQWKYACIIGLCLATIISPIGGIGYAVGWCIALTIKTRNHAAR